VITIFGSNATLDAGQKGRFFFAIHSGKVTSLELHEITLKNGKSSGTSGDVSQHSISNHFQAYFRLRPFCFFAIPGIFVPMHGAT
jgi:hypothetical protein